MARKIAIYFISNKGIVKQRA